VQGELARSLEAQRTHALAVTHQGRTAKQWAESQQHLLRVCEGWHPVTATVHADASGGVCLELAVHDAKAPRRSEAHAQTSAPLALLREWQSDLSAASALQLGALAAADAALEARSSSSSYDSPDTSTCQVRAASLLYRMSPLA